MVQAANPHAHRLQAIDEAALTPLVRKALDRPAASITNWDCQPVSGGVGGARFDTFIYRFTGQADDQGVCLPWSLILKILTARTGEQPADPQYWRREAELYRSGLLNDLPGSFFAPRCFDVIEYPGEACWLWLEELRDEIGPSWPLEHYGVAARHLGQFNGAYLAGRPLPSESWLSSGWFRKMAAQAAPNIPQVYNALTVPLLKAVLPSDAGDQCSRFWSGRDRFMDALDRLPHTFCHLDAFRRNLIARRGPDNVYQTAAIDWAYAGLSAVGAEIAVAILVALLFVEVEAKDAAEFDKVIFNGYLTGLAEAGWHGQPTMVRLGYTASVAAKYFETINTLPVLADEQTRVEMAQGLGRSVQDLAKQAAETFRFAHRMADEARGLMSQLD